MGSLRTANLCIVKSGMTEGMIQGMVGWKHDSASGNRKGKCDLMWLMPQADTSSGFPQGNFWLLSKL